MKRPSFQFYPSDWRKDSGLRLCSIAARGLWVEIMCIAHESDEYGKLKQNGRSFSHKTIAKLVGLSPQTCLKLLKELEENRVFSRDDDGTIYSRRMVRDEEIRNIRAESGSKGGNPNLLGNLGKQSGKQKPTPSSSSSSSSSNIVIDRAGEGDFDMPDLQSVLAFAETIGLAPWKAEDWFHEMEGCGWLDWLKRPVAKWQPLLNRIKTKWEADGRPDGPTKSKSFKPTKEERTTEFGY